MRGETKIELACLLAKMRQDDSMILHTANSGGQLPHRVHCIELRDCAARRVSFELSVSSIEVGDTLLHDLCEQFQDVAL